MKPGKNEAKTDYLKRCTDAGVKEGQARRTAYAECNTRWDSARKGSLHVQAPVTLAGEHLAAGDQTRGFLVTAKTGKPVKREYYTLAIDMAGIRTDPKLPVLRQHDPTRVVGHGQAYKDGDGLYVEGEFSKITEHAAEVLRLADEGFPWQASIGIWPDQLKTLGPGETMTVNGYKVDGPAIVYQKSHVREVSFVALGADPDTAAISFSVDAGAPILAADAGHVDELTGRVRELRAEGMDFYDAMRQIETESPHLLETAIKENEPMEKKKFKSVSDEIAAKARRLALEERLSLTEAIHRIMRLEPDLGHRWNAELLAEIDQ